MGTGNSDPLPRRRKVNNKPKLEANSPVHIYIFREDEMIIFWREKKIYLTINFFFIWNLYDFCKGGYERRTVHIGAVVERGPMQMNPNPQ